MAKGDEALKKIPREGFLKISESRTVDMPGEKKAALIRKGNELFNAKHYEQAKKIFLTTGYSDGLIRLGDYYIEKEMHLEAFRMYWLAPYPKKVESMMEKMVSIVKHWLEEE